ncbi:hypothetical protein Tsubulata_042974 [Turnera subulata]|uniref:RCC1-like domain-containing protein n=1 Tax=Turnera subulata TaxID=218843 RepID=A0A9Q0JD88_9ROSI|nr:hypothetical protein Tsubulata_042974 [Turnera subulata]
MRRNVTPIGLRSDVESYMKRCFRWKGSSSAAADPPPPATAGSRYAALWGNGDYGRLGLGSLHSHSTPKPLFPSAFHNQTLSSIACGGAHTLFLTESGRVYATGLNDNGQLGISDTSVTYSMEPVQVLGIEQEIVQISAGYHHSCAVSVDGELYMWGRNSSGQLGPRQKNRSSDVLTFFFHCCTYSPDEGQALSWGGRRIRLGHGHQSSILGFLKSSSEFTPRNIKRLEGVKVKKVATGLLHSACIDENGFVYVFGERAVAKLGFGEVNTATIPSMISRLPCAEEVACGGYHRCIVSKRVEGPFLRYLVGGSIQQQFLMERCLLGAGEALTHETFSDDGFSSGGRLSTSFDVAATALLKFSTLPIRSDASSSDARKGHGSDVDYVSPMLVDLKCPVVSITLVP